MLACLCLRVYVCMCVCVSSQGTRSSKRKKQAKLKRVMATVKKAERKEEAKGTEGFAALQLIHDPQVCVCVCVCARARAFPSRSACVHERFSVPHPYSGLCCAPVPVLCIGVCGWVY